MTVPKHSVTADRKSSSKLDLIVEHYSSMTRDELAVKLGETPRWIKRQIKLLKSTGRIQPKRSSPERILTEFDWTDEIKHRAMSLKRDRLMPAHGICKILKDEFSFDVPDYTLEFWLLKFGCRDRSKEEWLREFFPKNRMTALLDSNYRIVDIRDIINKTHGVDISEDLILVYLQSIGIESQRNRRVRIIREKANEFTKEWLDDQIQGHAGLSGLSEKMGVSKTVIMHRLKEEGLSLIKHRKIWSDNLETLRDLMLKRPPITAVISEEDRHQMFLGWLLGDGHLNSDGRFVVNHSLAQLSYLYLKYQILRDHVTNVITVPALHFSGDGTYFGGKEQMGMSCQGFGSYTQYLNEDGSKNFDKIAVELNDLGWACYFMDDGSLFSDKMVVSMSCEMLQRHRNRYRFGEPVSDHDLEVFGIERRYLIPHMFDKVLSVGSDTGSYWKVILPELFNVTIKDDFDLCFINKAVCDSNTDIMSKIVDYYHGRGFPVYRIADVYLTKEWEKLQKFRAEALWKNDTVMRYLPVGNALYKHFMPHMSEAKYRNVSPKQTFDSFSTFLTVLEYTLKTKKSVLPDFVHDNLVHFNGGVVGFPCSVAKAVTERYCPVGGTVVDPCAGWGGRLLGVSAAKRKYYGFEPWSKTFEGLGAITKYFSLSDAIVRGIEFDGSIAPEFCDIVFTSPPYVDLEIYGRPFTKNDWIVLIKAIFCYSEKSLNSGGYLILNLPKYLKFMLPATTLKEEPSVYWNTSSKVRTVDKAECLYAWRKQ